MSSEYLNTQELHQLTGYARFQAQLSWLKLQGLPFKVDGSRIIVSRLHVQRWIEGKPTVSHAGMNVSAIR